MSNLTGWSILGGALGMASSPFEHLTHVRQVHFDAVLVFVSLYIHVAELPCGTQFGDGCGIPLGYIAKRWEKRGLLFRSSGRSPIGVA